MTKRRAVTLQEVADRVGVSKMAVSAALRNCKEHSRVSEATRERILEVAAQMGYTPNEVARSLRRRSTNIIGMYCGYTYLDARNPFLGEIIGGLQEGCDQHQKDLLLHGVFRGLSVVDIYRQLADGLIDGLVLNASPDDPLVQRLAGSPLPVVAVVDAIPSMPSVVADDFAGARMVAEYLARQGHRRILYRTRLGTSLVSVQRRYAAFMSAARELALDVKVWRAPEVTAAEDRSVGVWLDDSASERPTAIVCWNDRSAYDLLSHCQAHGLSIPQDVAVVGFDGLWTPLECVVKLTTIKAPWAQVARTAVSLLVAQINGEAIPQETVLPVELVIGTTA